MVGATLRPVHGADAIARLLLGVRRRQPDLTIEPATVNGQAGLVARDGAGRTLAVVSVTIAGGLVDRVWAVRNPEKLTRWT
ncbi:hypothetical protein [Nonomuraea sp. NPDC005650]|uniref:hypothetical protein n=1 Tax=Nonomuraea sp. NPDC005650 TaxID=3157045 RepID=UPI0033B96739